MAEAVRDQNRIPTILAVLETDGVTPVLIKASVDGKLNVTDGADGIDNGPLTAERDQNHVTTMLAVSSVDGVTPVALRADALGRLLVQST